MFRRLAELWRRLRWWLVYLGPRRDITADTFNGRLTFQSKDWLIGKQLYVRRAFEAREVVAVIALLRQEGYLDSKGQGTILDVGANLGMICIALLKHGCFRRAVAFEPAPDSYRLLVHNIEQNGFRDRILAFPYALSSAPGEGELELSGDNSGDHRLRRSRARGAFREERRPTLRVAIKTLDGMLAANPAVSPEDVSLVWLDIQGYEGHFLLGGRNFFRRHIPVVSEFWPYALARAGMSRPEFTSILSELFTHFYIWTEGRYQKRAIPQVDKLFDEYARPREMCQIILTRDR